MDRNGVQANMTASGEAKGGERNGIADHVRALIEKRDKLVSLFGMEIEEVRAGEARVSMTVRSGHLNAAGLCHGAAIYALSDVAFALACNSHGRQALALEVSVNYLRPAKEGDRLTAVCSEFNIGNTTGLYHIAVTDQEGRRIAFLKATAYRFERSLVD